jgi:hypothetical protein
MVTSGSRPALDIEGSLVVGKRAMGEPEHSFSDRLFCDDIVARGTQVG